MTVTAVQDSDSTTRSHGNCVVSLIIVNYNGAALLPNCIESALPTLPPDGEIVVVDNASTDASLIVLSRYNGRVRVVPSARNLGFGRACNLGVAAARGDLLVFLNPDVTFVPNWLEPLARVAASNPHIGLLCPQMLYPDTPVPTDGSITLEDHAMLPGCGLTARRDVWLMLGGFDETFFLYWEDTELCWRAWLLGWRVVNVLGSSIYHQRGATTGAFGGWDAERARNSLYTYLKLMRWPSVLAYVLRLLAVCLVKSILRPALAPGLAWAWIWNAQHLPATLGARRRLAAHRIGSYQQLERMIRRDTKQLQAHWAARVSTDEHKVSQQAD